jgi:hypothetical protein
MVRRIESPCVQATRHGALIELPETSVNTRDNQLGQQTHRHAQTLDTPPKITRGSATPLERRAASTARLSRRPAMVLNSPGAISSTVAPMRIICTSTMEGCQA